MTSIQTIPFKIIQLMLTSKIENYYVFSFTSIEMYINNISKIVRRAEHLSAKHVCEHEQKNNG